MNKDKGLEWLMIGILLTILCGVAGLFLVFPWCCLPVTGYMMLFGLYSYMRDQDNKKDK